MPTTVYFPKASSHAGIDIAYTKSTQKLAIHGWHDGFVGIEGETIDLASFFIALGISGRTVGGHSSRSAQWDIKMLVYIKTEPNLFKVVGSGGVFE